jgi:hypothetical protein
MDTEKLTKLFSEAFLRVNGDNGEIMASMGEQASLLATTCSACRIFGCHKCIDDCPYPEAWPSVELLKTDDGYIIILESFALGTDEATRDKIAGYVKIYQNKKPIEQMPVVINLPKSH